jgi:hypothetical protein
MAMPFEPGQSGNPAGRKAGQPNRLTMAARAQIASGADPVGFLQHVMAGEAVTQADGERVTPTLDQRIRAAMTLTNKLVPDARDMPVSFSVGRLDGPSAALEAMGAVTGKMAAGELTPSEAGAVISVIAQYAKTYELTELERRIGELEAVRQGKAVAS